MDKVNKSVSGLTPDQWEEQLEQVAEDPAALADSLGQLEHEMHQENVWMHKNPTCGNLFKTLFRFFGQHNTSLEQLGKRIQEELHAERRLKERYRSWMPGEDYLDRLFPYLKGFGAPVQPDDGGLQFPGFTKYKGIKRGAKIEVFSFYISNRFPGRDPANFHLSFDSKEGELVIERVYKMELPRIEGIPTVGRAVTAELIADITTQPAVIRRLVIDNAANLKTREALIISHKDATV